MLRSNAVIDRPAACFPRLGNRPLGRHGLSTERGPTHRNPVSQAGKHPRQHGGHPTRLSANPCWSVRARGHAQARGLRRLEMERGFPDWETSAPPSRIRPCVCRTGSLNRAVSMALASASARTSPFQHAPVPSLQPPDPFVSQPGKTPCSASHSAPVDTASPSLLYEASLPARRWGGSFFVLPDRRWEALYLPGDSPARTGTRPSEGHGTFHQQDDRKCRKQAAHEISDLPRHFRPGASSRPVPGLGQDGARLGSAGSCHGALPSQAVIGRPVGLFSQAGKQPPRRGGPVPL